MRKIVVVVMMAMLLLVAVPVLSMGVEAAAETEQDSELVIFTANDSAGVALEMVQDLLDRIFGGDSPSYALSRSFAVTTASS